MTTKRCSRCEETKPVEAFSRCQKTKDGRSYWCKTCYATYWKENRERIRAYRQGDDVERITARQRAYCRKKIGFSAQLFDMLLTKQARHCAICRCQITESASADHCHSSGDPRGVLCNNCNSGLGFFKDDPARLQSAIAYLQSPPATMAFRGLAEMMAPDQLREAALQSLEVQIP
jgi:hypothetical protein